MQFLVNAPASPRGDARSPTPSRRWHRSSSGPLSCISWLRRVVPTWVS